ncbi:uncharacterized mitochondrial protein AtMg00310-like [Telopea speciosissima]|uniref:uncharacterized mitochondrial protein AtMg00310-like n=1 Tax=Telopea speciosissima TaxID=54955 RepID=UPI001CC43F52|nr:uncharacterized mitochondrial protein AtMg00310-like [Telopea speciosissima]
MLSKAGREVLIKSVASTISSYAGSHFILPASHHETTRKATTNFFYGQEDERKKLHWISWTRLCRSKEKGGLGFREPTLHNRALLAKVAWRLFEQLDSLWAKFMKAIYFPNRQFLDASLGHNPSWAWRSILEGRKVVESGLLWSIGNGNKVNIWSSNWIPSHHNFKIQGQRPSRCHLEKVEDLIDHGNRVWNMDLLNQLFSEEDREAIKKIHLSVNPSEDYVCWGGARNGLFSIKTVYHLLSNQRDRQLSSRVASS